MFRRPPKVREPSVFSTKLFDEALLFLIAETFKTLMLFLFYVDTFNYLLERDRERAARCPLVDCETAVRCDRRVAANV